jgi:SAM-dependent methyltransferase
VNVTRETTRSAVAGAVAGGAVRCRVCGSEECEVLGPPVYRLPHNVAGVPIDLSDLDLSYCRCRACGYEFIFPPIPDERLLECYRTAAADRWETDGNVTGARGYARKKAVLDRFAPGRRVLDFGCFDGGFLGYLGPDYDRWGIEPSATAAEAARGRGVRILGATVDAVDPAVTEPFDAITVFDVVEHLNWPVDVLRKVGRLLKLGGVVLVETGNTDARMWRRVGRFYQYCSYVDHVGFFNPTSIREAGRRAGLEVASVERTVHTEMPPAAVLGNAIYNSVYCLMRGATRLGLPLPRRLGQIGRGPFPRTTDARDHLLAVLRRPVGE